MVEAHSVVVHLRQPSGSSFTLRCSAFKAHSGHITCLVGPNGSGKSTFLRVLGGLIVPVEGSVSMNGILQAARALERKSTWLEPNETAHLVPFLTVRDHLLAVVKPIWSRTAASSSLQSLSLEAQLEESHLPKWCCKLVVSLAEKRVRELSTGQTQAVRLAMCLLRHKPLILADESTANLDVLHGKRVFQAFRQMVQREGAAAVIVTHDVFLAAEFADAIYLAIGGEIRETLDIALKNPQTSAARLRELIEAGEMLPTSES